MTPEMDGLGSPRLAHLETASLVGRGGMGWEGMSPGCQDVVPNANDVVGSHLARDYPLNGGLRPESGPAITRGSSSLASELHRTRVKVA